MRTWFPESGERWVFQVEAETIREVGGKRFVRYRPVYLQQHGAERELEECVFREVFTPVDPARQVLAAGERWFLPVEVTKMDKTAMTVDYRHIKRGEHKEGELRRMSLHVFRASFRREADEHPAASTQDSAVWVDGRRKWQGSQKALAIGDWFILNVSVLEVRSSEGRRLIKYMPDGQQTESAPRVLDENVFRQIFEPVDGAVNAIVEGDGWFMMVEVTEYDSEEFTVWYRPISSSGERKGGIRHLSDYIFLATFRPAK
ncbi:MAG: hypothetical protein WC889_15995 [Myxococcota bacterium]|jgi:hypothetical protein